MHKKKIVLIIIGVVFSLSFQTSGIQSTSEKTDPDDLHAELRPVMHVDGRTLEQWAIEYQDAELAYTDPLLHNEIATTDSYSILEYLDYVPSERDQGWCSNCWAWPATAAVAIALYVQEGIFDRLSVQYINSCGESVGVDCCEGGNLDIFCRFYRYTDKAIPWSNTNADWRDKRALCITPCESIATEPNYPISSIWPRTVETHELPEDVAIENIKNQLHQENPVYFSWYLPDMNYREDFQNWWQSYSETSIYDLDWDCGAEYIEEEGGGHAVLCVGYNDDEGTDNDYWVMLNSWGTPSQRPNGLFPINMHMNYDCTIMYEGNEYYSFDFQTIDVNFNANEEAPNAPTITGPSSGKTNTPYTFQFSSVDNQGHDVYYLIDWDDGTDSGWLGPYASGEPIEVSHTWTSRKVYSIRAKAKDINDAESLWATLEISMPKVHSYYSYNPLMQFILKLFERASLL